MTIDRIKEIQAETAYPNSISVQQALLKVWNECQQEQGQVKNCSIPDVVGSLPLIEIDKEMLQMCVEMYKSGDKITAVKWLMEEAKKDTYRFGIKWASEYLEKQ